MQYVVFKLDRTVQAEFPKSITFFEKIEVFLRFYDKDINPQQPNNELNS